MIVSKRGFSKVKCCSKNGPYYDIRRCDFTKSQTNQHALRDHLKCGAYIRITFRNATITVQVIDAGPAAHPSANAMVDLSPSVAKYFAQSAGLRWTGCDDFAIDRVKVEAI